MDFLTDSQFWFRWLRIVLIDLVLAGDNAVVIALAVHALAPKEQWRGKFYGTLGAIVLRIGFVMIVTQLLRIPYFQAVGGVVLLGIAWRLLQPTSLAPEKIRRGHSVCEAIGIIIVADIAMSLDNVLAIAGAAEGDLLLVVMGLFMSLPLIVWGSGLLARLMEKWPLLIWLGGGVLGFVAAEMIFEDRQIGAWLDRKLPSGRLIVPYIIGAIATIYGWLKHRGSALQASSKSNHA